ncbi:adenylosuccinate synthetase [Chondromyces crocatus]|uniref:Adenylosuccinate synthetase n=1 Tax=Chondromyces crocatus TaxID=52 RepID=A0A0K1ELU1_CHOCO|nr:adenylosuccinate synthetase [Chondromyces crocatus]AKT41796.1 adenylosuccinate synthase [Chondromyces crocatus]
MAKRIIVLSGPVASGKTTLGDALIARYGFERLKTRDLIRSSSKTAEERAALQEAGEALDRETDGKWVAQELSRVLSGPSRDATVIVDAVRIEKQIEAIREIFGLHVIHVHVRAPGEVLANRYAQRRGRVAELASYDDVRANATERDVESLASIADVVIDTARCSEHDVVVRVASHLGLYGRGIERLVDVVVGGQFGSEGKGHIVSYLAPAYDLLVRVGGPNAGHTVYERPKPYTFHLLPSGTRHGSAQLLLGPGAVIHTETLRKEIEECQVMPGRLFIDPQAMVIDSHDSALEAQMLTGAIGSTGQGVGVATSRKVLRTAAAPAVQLARDVLALQPYLRSAREVLDDAFSEGRKILLEGTQGTGLSLHHGAYPYVTSRDTTVSGCLAEAGIAPSRVRKIIMACRAYPIRVQNPQGGSSGPLAGEIGWDEVARRSGLDAEELRSIEKTSTTRRDRRVGEFDWSLLRGAVSLNGPTDIALTFVDYIDRENKKARRFEQLTPETIRFVEEIERVASAPVSLITTRFDVRSIIDRRSW